MKEAERDTDAGEVEWDTVVSNWSQENLIRLQEDHMKLEFENLKFEKQFV